MNTNEKATLLSSDKSLSTFIDENGCGVTYFKLSPEEKWGSDYTKGCGLLGEDIDKNFFFLRGYDIKSVEFDEERNLIINRVNPKFKPLVVNLTDNREYSFEFDRENGTLVVTDREGNKTELGGFLVEGKDIRMATDSTLKGNGTVYKPLGLSTAERTGTYAPAAEYFDITADNVMPEGKGNGYRIVTKEVSDKFGRLYPFEAVRKIAEQLEETGSQWRVPTKDDWDELLNAFEPCDEDKNHSMGTVGFLGRFAGSSLKSFGTYTETIEDGDGLWKDYQPAPTLDPTVGQDVANLEILPLGRSAERNFFMGDEDNDAEGFGTLGSFWANTIDAQGNAFVKTFVYNDARVLQESKSQSAKLSIRLCKEYKYSNFNANENILGVNYPCELVYSPYEGNDYVKVWTSVNIGFSDSELEGVVSSEWAAASDNAAGRKEVYFINEWNGSEWTKKPMNDGDSVVIINKVDGGVTTSYHEWRVEGSLLVDTVSGVASEFNGTVADINNKINAEANRLDGRINNEIEKRVEEVARLDGRVDAEEAKHVEDIERLDGRVDAEESKRAEDVARLDGRVDAEESKRAADDMIISSRIDNETQAREDADAVISGLIDAEKTKRIEEVERLDGRVNAVETKHIEDIARVDGRVGTEETKRAEEVARLDGRIDAEDAKHDEDIASLDGKDIKDQDITLLANESVEVLRKNGNVAGSISISDDFFNFGEIITE